MKGLMQPNPMNLVHVLEHAARFHGGREIVSSTVEGGIHRYTYSDALARTKKFANALQKLGVDIGDRVGTLAWNGYRHFETWYAISGQGAITHTVNPRLFPDQVAYIINHAADKFVVLDTTFVSLVEGIQDQLSSVEGFVILADREHMPQTSLKNVHCYEDLIADEPEEFAWPELDEETASSLCYTSGTTGNPKGVMYSHRSNILMALAVNGAEGFGLTTMDSVLMVVPQFHANSWGLVYSAPMSGAKLVLPGPNLDGKSTYDLITNEQVTFSAAVPTVWNIFIAYLEEIGGKLPTLREVVIGGSAVPRSMIKIFDEKYDVKVLQAWGMTETNPLGTLNRTVPEVMALDHEAQLDYATKQGRPLFGVDIRIANDAGQSLPHDGKTPGRLMVRGPWVIQSYYGLEESVLDADGWFDTSDIATIDELGFMQITDRAKDVIKSGGEWISSVDLENTAMGHESVAMAAVIGMPHPKWDERPLLILQLREGASVSKEEMLDYLGSRVAKWWLPDDVVEIDVIPLGGTGKINKLALRETFKDYVLPTI